MLPIHAIYLKLEGTGQMGKTGIRFARYRMDSGQHHRILLVMVVLGLLAFVPVGIRWCAIPIMMPV